jgi:site-specific recombinase XerD
LTIRCYSIDVSQFLSWIQENDLTVSHPVDITKSHLSEYLSSLSDQGLSGRTRARKLAAIKGYFCFLVAQGTLPVSPTETMSAPKRERNGRTYLTPDEYTRLLSLAGSNLRDYAILQASRLPSVFDVLFLNYQGEPISERGVQKLLAKYVKLSGITKKILPTLCGTPLPRIRQSGACVSLPAAAVAGT